MALSENPNWLLESLMEDIPVTEGDFAEANGGFYWAAQGFNPSSDVSSLANSDGIKEPVTGKRARSETSSKPATKACREKMRRDKLNDRFLELGSLLEPGKTPKTDKAAILSEAARMVTQLRSESQKLKESNDSLQEKIKELKAEKNELRDEKQRLKAEKDSLEQQVKLLNARASYIPHPPVMPTPFAVQGQAAGHKLMMPIIGYPGYPMWQFMPPADVDTSQDADKCPPVA
ncbi:transcription factor ILR3-like [Canna indica]|uniref:Transcription factor ILR3-like n=1 Tax=Canna indica TaxID=4628 RepID=A0AAQ3QRA9_9LILI|nr:transcription factor ILR3-like [Canna indica]